MSQLPVTQGRTVGMGLLSWKAHRTLENTLKTYAEERLFSLFDETRVLFQEASADVIRVADRYGIQADGTDKNTGIYGGVKRLLEGLGTNYVLLLENDCPLIEGHAEASRQLSAPLQDAVERQIPAFRFLLHPGEGFATRRKFLRYYADRVAEGAEQEYWLPKVRRLLRPAKASRLKGIAAYASDRPEAVFPEVFERTDRGLLLTSSAFLNWTNQAVLVDRRLMLEEILPYVDRHPSHRVVNGFSDIGKEINCAWWRQQRFPIGLVDGLFTHERIDR